MRPDSGRLEIPAVERVRRETARIMDSALHVQIDEGSVRRHAAAMAERAHRAPAWDRDRQFCDGSERTAEWIFVLDTLNFSFWPDPGRRRWRVSWKDEMHRGYFALSCALKRGLLEGYPLDDPSRYAALDDATLAYILRGEGEIPLLAERGAMLREHGRILCDRWEGKFTNLLKAAKGSASRLVDLLVGEFPGFRDVAYVDGTPVHFLKRAQILASDLWGAFGGEGWGAFSDMQALTAFADYRIPQILRSLRILVYGTRLAAQVDAEEPVAPGSREEVEIRAGTVQGVEKLVAALRRRGIEASAFAVDWHLWKDSHSNEHNLRPYHLTRTVWY